MLLLDLDKDSDKQVLAWRGSQLFMVPVYASESVSTSSTCSYGYLRCRNAISSTRFAFNSKYFDKILLSVVFHCFSNKLCWQSADYLWHDKLNFLMLYFFNKIKHRSTQSHDFVSMTVLTGFYASWRVEQSLLNLSDWRSHGFLLHLQKPIWVSVEFLSMFIYRNPIWQAQNLLVCSSIGTPSLWPIFLESYICLCLCIYTIS